jgi:4-alpha-glucanotransferase
VVYTGTHDNDPVNGWFAALSDAEKELIRNYYHCHNVSESDMHHVLVASAMMSRANTCVVPLQDYIGLGKEARVNDPSHEPNNWFWRLEKKYLTEELCKEIFETTRRYGRLNWDTLK